MPTRNTLNRARLTQRGVRETATDYGREIYSVSRLNSETRAVLEGSFPLLWVQGEISNLAQPSSGHIYFSLKDPGAQVRCAMFRQKRLLLGFMPANGQDVLARVRVGLYEARGDFQLVVEQMEPAGDGALRLELERLKRRLSAEGLLDETRKRQLPPFPRQVGLITSASGAAVHDLVSVMGRRFPSLPVVIYPVQVQGEGAAQEIMAALDLANRRQECDLLVVARGGGSLEDLMAFNDEGVVRAIVASEIPVVCGVGHEVDVTIADLAADRRAATPSAAAELVTPSAEHLAQRLRAFEVRLADVHGRLLSGLRHRLDAAVRHMRLLHPRSRLERQSQALDLLERRLLAAVDAGLRRSQLRLQSAAPRLQSRAPGERLARYRAHLADLGHGLAQARRRRMELADERLRRAILRLDDLSPLATLSRGYAVVRDPEDGAILTDAAKVSAGDRVDVRLHRGELVCRVESTERP